MANNVSSETLNQCHMLWQPSGHTRCETVSVQLVVILLQDDTRTHIQRVEAVHGDEPASVWRMYTELQDQSTDVRLVMLPIVDDFTCLQWYGRVSVLPVLIYANYFPQHTGQACCLLTLRLPMSPMYVIQIHSKVTETFRWFWHAAKQ